jgi:hypothetical protein
MGRFEDGFGHLKTPRHSGGIFLQLSKMLPA